MLQFLTRLIARYFERAMDRAWKCPSLSRPQDLFLSFLLPPSRGVLAEAPGSLIGVSISCRHCEKSVRRLQARALVSSIDRPFFRGEHFNAFPEDLHKIPFLRFLHIRFGSRSSPRSIARFGDVKINCFATRHLNQSARNDFRKLQDSTFDL